MDLNNLFLAFVPIFVAVDALGMIPVFLGLTEGMSHGEKTKLIRHSVLTALFVAVTFLFVGKLVFSWLGITLNDFLIAGGAILFIVSIRDLLSYSRASRLPDQVIGVVPIAVPLIVGPAVLASTLILFDTYGLVATLFSIVSNILLCGVILFYSGKLSKILGEVGSQTLSKISNLLLAAIGVMLIRRGLFEVLNFFFQNFS